MADPTTLGLIHEAQKRILDTQEDHDKRIRSVEQAIVLLTELVKEEHTPKPSPQSFLDVFKNPAVVIVAIVCFFALLAFAIARDPSTAGRVVDKVPTRESVK